MTQPGALLDLAPLGVRIELRRTAADTGGELVEADVIGCPRGILAERHVHACQEEELEVLDGGLELTIAGRRHVLGPGRSMIVPAGVAHRQRVLGDAEARIRIRHFPAGDTEGFLRRLADMAASGAYIGGYPRPVAGAALVRDYGTTGHAARPSMRVQLALSRVVLRLAGRRGGGSA